MTSSNFSRRFLLCLATGLTVSLAWPTHAQQSPSVEQLAIGPEHFFLTLDEPKGKVMVDLLPFKSSASNVAQADRPAFAAALGRKVAALVLEELEAADANKLTSLVIDFVYVTQRDEYEKPRPGGLQKIGTVEATIANGAVANVTSGGNFTF